MVYNRYALQRHSRQQPQRPVGVTILAILGILLGLGIFALVVLNMVAHMQEDMPMLTVAFDLAVGTGIALFCIWLHWGLWDLMPWAWWLCLVLQIMLAVVCVVMLFSAPVLAPLLNDHLPFTIQSPQVMIFTFVSGVVIYMVINLCIAIYMVSIHKTFGIGVKHRPAWERPRI